MLVYYCCSHNATTEPTSVTQDSTDTIEPRPPGIPVREFLPGIAEPKIPKVGHVTPSRAPLT